MMSKNRALLSLKVLKSSPVQNNFFIFCVKKTDSSAYIVVFIAILSSHVQTCSFLSTQQRAYQSFSSYFRV